MSNTMGMCVCLLANLHAPGFYTLNNPLNPGPDINLQDVCSPKLHAAATLPASSRSDPHGGDLRYLKTTSTPPLGLGGGKTCKPGPDITNLFFEPHGPSVTASKEFLCTVPFAQPASA